MARFPLKLYCHKFNDFNRSFISTRQHLCCQHSLMPIVRQTPNFLQSYTVEGAEIFNIPFQSCLAPQNINITSCHRLKYDILDILSCLVCYFLANGESVLFLIWSISLYALVITPCLLHRTRHLAPPSGGSAESHSTKHELLRAFLLLISHRCLLL